MTVFTVNPIRRSPRQNVGRPSVNIIEAPKAYRLEFFVPGFDKEHFALEVNEDILTIRGEVPEVGHGEEGTTYLRRDFTPIAFERRFELPEQVNQEAISAQYEQGILQVTLPFREEVPEIRRRIEIQ